MEPQQSSHGHALGIWPQQTSISFDCANVDGIYWNRIGKMSDFEKLDHSWEQAERFRHAALLRQLKAELQEVRSRSRPAAPPPMPVPKEQPSQPDPGITKWVRS